MAILTSTSVTGVTDLNIAGFFDGYLRDYSERLNALGNTTATTNINLANGTFVTCTLATNTTFTFTLGTKTTTAAVSFSLLVTNDATASRVITWPASVKWPGGVAPTRTTAANRSDVFTFFTFNGGTNWWGSLSLLNYA